MGYSSETSNCRRLTVPRPRLLPQLVRKTVLHGVHVVEAPLAQHPIRLDGCRLPPVHIGINLYKSMRLLILLSQ